MNLLSNLRVDIGCLMGMEYVHEKKKGKQDAIELDYKIKHDKIL